MRKVELTNKKINLKFSSKSRNFLVNSSTSQYSSIGVLYRQHSQIGDHVIFEVLLRYRVSVETLLGTMVTYYSILTIETLKRLFGNFITDLEYESQSLDL